MWWCAVRPFLVSASTSKSKHLQAQAHSSVLQQLDDEQFAIAIAIACLSSRAQSSSHVTNFITAITPTAILKRKTRS